MRKRAVGPLAVVVTTVCMLGVGTGSASAASGWKGPYNSHSSCIVASGENRGLHFVNVKVACEKHHDGKWWWMSRW